MAGTGESGGYFPPLQYCCLACAGLRFTPSLLIGYSTSMFFCAGRRVFVLVRAARKVRRSDAIIVTCVCSLAAYVLCNWFFTMCACIVCSVVICCLPLLFPSSSSCALLLSLVYSDQGILCRLGLICHKLRKDARL